MPTFDDRERGEEAKYVRADELRFKTEARRNRLLGQWAAAELGLTGSAADDYVAEVVAADFAEVGDEDVFRKIAGDFRAKNIRMSDDVIRHKMAECLTRARTELGVTG